LVQVVNFERRKHRRVPLEGTIKVRILAPGPRQEGVKTFSIAEGHLYDVTTVGAFVATSLILDRGQRIEIEIATSGLTNPKRLVAVVARCTGHTKGKNGHMPPGLGVCFIAQSEEERERIREMVMATLTLDLLDYGYERQLTPTTSETIIPGKIAPGTGETITPGKQLHPIRWTPPVPGDSPNHDPSPPPDKDNELSADDELVDTLLEGIMLEDTDLATALWHLG
jgi:hypothetical protein